MSYAAGVAGVILTALSEAQSILVGRVVVLSDGKAGAIERVDLDEEHGLRIAIQGHDGRWPVSTIKIERVDE